jgi:phosphate-selective porin OprO/OprP
MCATLIVVIVLLLVPSAARAQERPQLPTVRLGDLVDVAFHVTLQTDWEFDAEGEGPQPSFEFRRARVGLEGTLFRRIDYQIERDFHSDATPWADAYANVALAPGLQLRAGHFKVPFSLDRLTGRTDLDFTYRSLAAEYLAPGRSIGAMAHGNTFGKRLRYQAGVFRGDGDNLRDSQSEAAAAGALVGGRVVVRPWAQHAGARILSKLGFGGSATANRIPAGRNSIRGDDHGGERLFHEVEVAGVRRRLGMELEWRYGPVAVRGERIHLDDQRRGQGTDDDDLPEAIADGWYVSSTCLLTGERKVEEVQPSRSLLRGGPGAIELAARIEAFRFGSAGSEAPASRDPRARTIAADADRALTLGVNWYAISNLKLQLDVVREQLTTRGLTVRDGRWRGIIRLQVVL